MPTTAKPRASLSRSQARRVALAAKGFQRARPDRPVGMRDVQGVINRLGQFQIDSVNVVTRAHHVPLFSRLGAYDLGLLARASNQAPRRLFEYWGHAASLVDVELHPLLRFRMRANHAWDGVNRVVAANPDLVVRVRELVGALGPATARELELAVASGEVRDRSSWGWNWSSVKVVLEWLFSSGEVSAAGRNSQFERLYDLTERVLPPTVLARPDPTPEESVRGLVRRAAQALGVGSEFCLRDYFRTRPETTRQAIADLVDSGELVPVAVEGWSRPTWMWHEAALPRWTRARALLCPFDSMVFERARLEALFDFFYRIEIYVPEPKRVHGYYVYPFLLGERFEARVDLKADRQRDVLLVKSAWAEPEHRVGRAEVAAELAAELALMARWLGVARVEVQGTGDLAPALSVEVAAAAA